MYNNRLEAMYWKQQKVNPIIQIQSLKTKQTSTVREILWVELETWDFVLSHPDLNLGL